MIRSYDCASLKRSQARGFTLFLRFFAGRGGADGGGDAGSLQTLLISETLLGGFKRGARITLAPLITDAPIIIAVLLS